MEQKLIIELSPVKSVNTRESLNFFSIFGKLSRFVFLFEPQPSKPRRSLRKQPCSSLTRSSQHQRRKNFRVFPFCLHSLDLHYPLFATWREILFPSAWEKCADKVVASAAPAVFRFLASASLFCVL